MRLVLLLSQSSLNESVFLGSMHSTGTPMPQLSSFPYMGAPSQHEENVRNAKHPTKLACAKELNALHILEPRRTGQVSKHNTVDGT